MQAIVERLAKVTASETEGMPATGGTNATGTIYTSESAPETAGTPARDTRNSRDASKRHQNHQGCQQETPEIAGTPAIDTRNSRDARKTGDACGSSMLATAGQIVIQAFYRKTKKSYFYTVLSSLRLSPPCP
jgi:hypothetical protein